MNPPPGRSASTAAACDPVSGVTMNAQRTRPILLLVTAVLLAVLAMPVRADDVVPVERSSNEATNTNGEQPETSFSQGVAYTPAALIEQMSWYAIPFGIASVIALWYSIERLVVLRRGRVIPKSFVDRFLSQLQSGKLDARGALDVCEENGSPVANVFAHGVRKWGKPSVEVEQAIIDGGEREVAHLRQHLRIVNGVATVTPLLGLLGTVVGMIQAFNQIATSEAMGKADQLAGGIALALLTTAAGLAIAIPSLIVYMYLAGRVDALVMEMDHLAQNVVHLISAEGLQSRAKRPRGEETTKTPPAAKKRGA